MNNYFFKLSLIILCISSITISSFPQEPLKILNHPKEVNTVLFSPNGKYLATCAFRVVRIYNVINWQIIDSIPNRTSPIAFSPDGSKIATCLLFPNYSIDVHEIKTEKIVKHVFCSIECSICFSPDGNFLAVGGMSKRVAIFSISTNDFIGKFIKELDNSTALIESISYSPNGLFIAAGSFDGSITIWNVHTGLVYRTLRDKIQKDPLSPGVQYLTFSPNGKFLAVSDPLKINIYKIYSGDNVLTLTSHKSLINCLSYAPNGKFLASGSYDQSILIWDLNNGKVKKTFKGHSGSVLSVSFSSNGNMLASGSLDQSVKIWDTSFLNE